MNRNIIFSIALFILSGPVLMAQTNIFTLAGNGDFETVGNENDFGVVGPQTYYGGWTATRSSDVAYSGSYSMKCVGVNKPYSPFRVLASKTMTQAQAGKSYVIRTRVYVPSTAGIENGRYITLGISRDFDLSTGTVSNCNGGSRKSFQVGTDPFNQWIDIYTHITPNFSTPDNLFVYFYLGDFIGTFYIDKVEVFEIPAPTPITLNASVDYAARNITLNPSGGIPGWNYTYSWADNGFTGKDRLNLPYGTYTATVNQTITPMLCPGKLPAKSESFKFLVPPVITNTNLTVCVNDGITLTASVSEGYIAWYNVPVGGTDLASGPTFRVIPRVPGQYLYYAECNSGSSQFPVPSPRTQVIVTATGPAAEVVLKSNVVYSNRPIEFIVNNHQSGYSYEYKFVKPNGSSSIVNTIEPLLSWMPSSTGQYSVNVRVTDSSGCYIFFDFTVSVSAIIPLCSTLIPKGLTGELKLDKISGQVVFDPSAACVDDFVLGCIAGKVEAPVKNAVAASATTFSDRWNYDYLPGQQASGGAVEKGEIGKWRPQATYAYNKGSVTIGKNNNSGSFTLTHFNWQYPKVNTKTGWLKVNEITKYSPHGEAVEERNALNIASTAKFGYRNTLPYLIAQNSDYNSVLFESFENVYGSSLEDGVTVNGGTRDATVQHSGAYSFKLSGQFIFRTFSKSTQLEQKGVLVRLWAKGNDLTNAIGLSVITPSQTLTRSFKQIARSGAWSLWEARLEPNSFTLTNGQNFQVSVNKLMSGDIWIDDVRIQPLDAELTCYVYDVQSLRLLAVLDDQHFAMFYQYNAEGKLVRKMIETERGVKTVQETQYNIPQVSKSK